MPIDESDEQTDIRLEIDIVDLESGARPLPADGEADSVEVHTLIRGRSPADGEAPTMDPEMDPETSPKRRGHSFADSENTLEPRTVPAASALADSGSVPDADNADQTIEPQKAKLASPAEEDPSTLEPHMSVRSIDGTALAKMREVLKEEETETSRSIAIALEQAAHESSVAWEEVERRSAVEEAPKQMPQAGAAPRKSMKRARTFIGIAPPPVTQEGIDEPEESASTDSIARDTIVETTEKRKPLFLMTPVDPITVQKPAPSDLPPIVIQPRPAAGEAAPVTVVPATVASDPAPATAPLAPALPAPPPRTEKMSKFVLPGGEEPPAPAHAAPRTEKLVKFELPRPSSGHVPAAVPQPPASESGRFGLSETLPAPTDSSRSDRWNIPPSSDSPSSRQPVNLPSVRRIDPALVPPIAISRHSIGSDAALDPRAKGRRSAAMMMALAFVLAGGGASALIVWQATKKSPTPPAASSVAHSAASMSPPDDPPAADSVASSEPTAPRPGKNVRPSRPRFHPPPPPTNRAPAPRPPPPAPTPPPGKFDPTAI